MNNQKPWKSFDDQLSLLEERGLVFDNRSTARNYLSRIGYYRLSGYWYPFRQPNPNNHRQKLNQFIAGSRFEDAVQLYVFDKKLRLLAFDAIERIELALRVDISHLLGKREVCAQYNPTLFHGKFSKHRDPRTGKTGLERWLEDLNKQIKRAHREPFIIHYQQKYQGKLPIWVSCELWDFGMLSHLFSGLKLEDQQIIAEKYGAIATRKVSNHRVQLAQWLRSLNFIRNVSAHHSRLWNINIIDRSNFIDADIGWKNLNNAKVFLYFCILQQMLKVICPNSSWGKRFKELVNTFPYPENSAISFHDMGLNSINLLKDWDLWQ